jgi:hypothetical protein
MSSLSQNSANLQLNTQPIISSEVVLVTVPMAQNWLSTMIENQRKPQVRKWQSTLGKWLTGNGKFPRLFRLITRGN